MKKWPQENRKLIKKENSYKSGFLKRQITGKIDPAAAAVLHL
jgi:hypothetical protein